MKKLNFQIEINAPVSKVYDTMLGLTNKETYEQWTTLFNPTSTYEGSWTAGSKILFVGVDEEGLKGGMVSEIAENIPNRFVSIKHRGLLTKGIEITEGPEVEKWSGGLENYALTDDHGKTSVNVEVEITEDFVDYMNETYPQALVKLKEICEQ
jgi:hypothetical protein